MSEPEKMTTYQAQDEILTELSRIMMQTGHTPTKFVLVVEAIDHDDGERMVFTMTHEGSMAWEILGLLDYARHMDIALRSARYTVQDLNEGD